VNLDYILAFVGAFAYVGLITMQQRLIASDSVVAVMLIGWAIEAAKMLGLLAVVKGGWAAYPYTAAGSSLGAGAGLILHRRIYGS
jgi:hypothetical protein